MFFGYSESYSLASPWSDVGCDLVLLGRWRDFAVTMATRALCYLPVTVVEVHVGTDRTSEHLLFGWDVFLGLPLVLVKNPDKEYPEK